jgi:hypothetical protein
MDGLEWHNTDIKQAPTEFANNNIVVLLFEIANSKTLWYVKNKSQSFLVCIKSYLNKKLTH